MRSHLLVLLATLWVCKGYAQTAPDIVTDRPDFTESGVTVSRGGVQIESGLTYVGLDGRSTVSLPELLLRWSPLERFEIRLGIPDYIGGDAPTGFADGSLGTKVQLGPVGSWDLAVIAAATVPVGDDVLSSNSLDPEFVVITGHELSSRASFGAQAMVMRDGTDELWHYGGTVVVGVDLGGKFGTFGEIKIVDERGNSVVTTIHHGYTYLISPVHQLDVHAGVGFFDEGGREFLIGAGLSRLF